MPTSATLKCVRCTVNKRGQNKSICRIEKQQFGLLTHDKNFKKKNRFKLRPLIFPDCMCLGVCVYTFCICTYGYGKCCFYVFLTGGPAVESKREQDVGLEMLLVFRSSFDLKS